MSPSPQLAPPGSSSYTSDTMHVGDGTWDAGRDNFLLPPLVGLNFATMRYNGMGNRFFTLTGYHPVVKAHGILATITFLFCIPAAIFIRRFGGRRPRLARQLHIWLNVLTLLLSTAVIALGAFAVGPSRALTNPHHGIGVAIYTLIWVQVLGGCLVYRAEKKRQRQTYIPLRAMLHHWLGRSIALLGIAQVPLGLTLYGSPLSLFVLYAIWLVVLVGLYFTLEWMHERRRSEYQSGDGQYTEEHGSQHEKRKSGGLGKLALAGAAGVGLAALFRRRSSGKEPEGSQVTRSSDGTSYMYDDYKYSEPAPRKTGLGHRLLQIGAIGGGIAAARKLFGGRREPDDASVSDAGPYRQHQGGAQSAMSESVSRIDVDRPPPRPTTPTAAADPGHQRRAHPLAQPPMTPGSGRRASDDDYSDYASYMSGSPSRQDRPHTFRQAIATVGTFAAVRALFKRRGERQEDRRAESIRRQRLEEERLQRMDSAHRYKDPRNPPARRTGHQYANSQTASDVSGTIGGSVLPGATGNILPSAGIGAAAAGALADRDHIRPVGTDPTIAHPGPASAMASNIPPLPPPHGPDFQSSGSDLYTTASGRQRHRHHPSGLGPEATMGAASLGAGAAAVAAAAEPTRRPNTNSVESPPVSLKVKMHNDGRHVTLRRLTEQEAAAQREARRKERRASANRRRRNSSMSGSSGGEDFGSGSADQRWRRTEAMEAQQAAENQAASSTRFSPMPGASTSGPIYPTPPAPGTQQGLSSQLPPPPPIPASTSNLGPPGSVGSPGTETSGATEYAANRRRRRAERAHARQAREGRIGNTVDFT